MKLTREWIDTIEDLLSQEQAGLIERGQPFRVAVPWISLHDDNGETHCCCCGDYLHEEDFCVARYYTLTSFVFCMSCFKKNETVIRSWIDSDNVP